jgi:hypothetical protein
VSFEETLAAVLDARLAPLQAELARVAAELAKVRAALPSQLVKLGAAARLMGVSVKTARRRCDAGEWPSRKDGRNVLVDMSALKPLSIEDVARKARHLRAVQGGSDHGQE